MTNGEGSRVFLDTNVLVFANAAEAPLRQITEQLLVLMERISIGGKQVHDANIVATMLVHDIPTLLTNNTDDFKRFSHLITVLPLDASVS